MTTTPPYYENVMLRRALLAMCNAFPAELTANARDVTRQRLGAGAESFEDGLKDVAPVQMRNHLQTKLAAHRAMLPVVCNPKRAAMIRESIEAIEGDIERIDRFLEPYIRRAADHERACLIEAGQQIKRASVNTLLAFLNAEEVRDALTDYLSAEMDLSVCGSNLDEFIANRAAMLTDGD